MFEIIAQLVAMFSTYLAPYATYIVMALTISEGLALIPAIKANGIVDGIIKILKAALAKKA